MSSVAMLLTGRREACIPTMDTSIYLYVTTAVGMGMNTALTMGMMQRKSRHTFLRFTKRDYLCA